MEWLKSVFSGAIDAGRVNPFGLAVMLIGIVVVIAASGLARKINPNEPLKTRNLFKLIGMFICAAGALIAIIG